MSPTPDPGLLTNILFALVLACAAVPAPQPGPGHDARPAADRHGQVPAFLRLRR